MQRTLGDLGLSDFLAVWDACPAMIAITIGEEHRLVFQNRASAKLFGRRVLEQPFAASFPETGPDTLSALDRVLAEGVVHEQLPPPADLLPGDDPTRHLHVSFAPLGVAAGSRARGVIMTAIDASAVALTERAGLQAQVLMDVSNAMNEAAQPVRALQALCETLVPALADLAAVYVTAGAAHELDLSTGLRRRPTRRDAAGPAAVAVEANLTARLGVPPLATPQQARLPQDGALVAGRAMIVDLRRDEQVIGDSSTREWLAAAGAHTMVLLPLVVAAELAGAVVLIAAGDRLPYLPAHLPFLEHAVTRAGAVVTQLRSYRDQRAIALELQRALLPDVPPTLEGAQVATRYVAGSVKVEVGGDWWDVVGLGEGQIGIGVGDVAGRGVYAAVVMGQARAAMRAAALAGLEPSRLLALLDTQLVDVLSGQLLHHVPAPPGFATAAYAVIDRRTQTLRVANAGHPPLAVRYPDGSTELVRAPSGTPLGLGVGDYSDLVVPFPTGSLLAAYTDGLVESRTRQVDVGIDLLLSLLAGVGPADDLDVAVGSLLTAMGRESGHDDDVAVVLVRTTGAPQECDGPK